MERQIALYAELTWTLAPQEIEVALWHIICKQVWL